MSCTSAFLRFLLIHSLAIQSISSFTPTLTKGSITGPSLDKRESISIFSLHANNDGLDNENNVPEESTLPHQLRRSLLISTAAAVVTNLGLAYAAPPNFQRIPTQYIAALGDPQSKSGSNANTWGIWTVDPGPRGVFLRDYKKDIESRNNIAPAGWVFDKDDFWVEEHGLIMQSPEFPVAAGKYLVTGGRLTTTVLEVDAFGNWNLQNGSLYDVTHLPCRSARYTPGLTGGTQGSPLTANQSDFPVKPGAEMPKVEGCEKIDYAVLFVIGKEIS